MKMAKMMNARSKPERPILKAIVSVNKEDRVRCGEVGCGRSVFRAIHVVQDDDVLLVLGSTCFAMRYGGSDALGNPSYGRSSGRQLTEAEREMLASNTAALLARFQAEDEEKERLQIEVLSRSVAPLAITHPANHVSQQPLSTGLFNSPWPWANLGKSMLYISFADGTAWIRVEHKDGKQRLVPWPKSDGWDEAWPASVGNVDLELGCLFVSDIKSAITHLRKYSAFDKVVGNLRELNALIAQNARPCIPTNTN